MEKQIKRYPYRETFTYDGKRYYVVAKTERELIEKVTNKKRDLVEGKVLINRSMTVSAWFNEWMEKYKEKSISEDTNIDYVSRFNSQIKPVIGSMKIKDVREIHCQEVLNGMDGYSKTYIAKVRYTMNQMFKRAVKNHLLNDNPAEDLEMLEAEDGTHRAITDIERKFILTVAKTHRGGLWVLTMLLTGIRPGESAALQGRNLDFKNNGL